MRRGDNSQFSLHYYALFKMQERNQGILSRCQGLQLAHDSERWVSFRSASALL